MKTRLCFRRRWGMCRITSALITASWRLATAGDIDPAVVGRWTESIGILEIISVAVSGNYAYLACGRAGLQIVDVSNPARPERVGSHLPESDGEYKATVWALTVSGRYVYLEASGRLEVIDVSDPLRPRLVGVDGHSRGNAQALVIANGHTYMAGYSSSQIDVFDVSEPTQPRWVTALPVGASGMLAVGNQLYLATGGGLEIFDVAAPVAPERISGHPIGGEARAVAVAGNRAYVASGGYYVEGKLVGAGLRIIDVGDPKNPRTIGTYQTESPATAITLADEHVVLAASGLKFIDVSDPTNPRQIGSYPASSGSRTMVVNGNSCYLAYNSSGFGTPIAGFLDVIDISNPAKPQLQSVFDYQVWPQDVAVSGHFAYVPELECLRVIDVSDPARPKSIGSVTTRNNANAVAVSGQLACIIGPGRWNGTAMEGRGLHLIDLSDPRRPVVLGRYDTGAATADVALSGEHAYVVGETGLQVIDISDPVNPRRVAKLETAVGLALGVVGNHLYIASGDLQVIDIKDPAAPVRVRWVYPGRDARSIAISGAYACVGGYDGLHVLDISDPGNPQPVRGYVGHHNRVLALSGNLACVTEGGVFEFMDISDPKKPRRVGLSATEGNTFAAAMSGNYVYAATGPSFFEPGLTVIDFGRPANPTRVGNNDAILSAADIEMSGHFAYLASYGDGLQVIDVSDPSKPTLAVRVDTPGSAESVAVSGAFAYVADGTYGLRVLDISNPAVPRLAGTCVTVGEAKKVATETNHAYVICRQEGVLADVLQVIDVTKPSQPQPVGRYDVRIGGIYRVSVSGTRAFMANHGRPAPFLEIIDVATPANPQPVGLYTLSPLGFPVYVEVSYVEDPRELWMMWDVSDSAGPKLIGGYRTIAAVMGIEISGHYAYVNDLTKWPKALEVFDLSDRSQPRLVGRNSSCPDLNAIELSAGRILVVGYNSVGQGGGLTVLEMLPFFKSFSPGNGQMHLHWEGWGKARLEGTTSLINPDWRDLGLPETATSASLPLTDPQAFFRLKKP